MKNFNLITGNMLIALMVITSFKGVCQNTPEPIPRSKNAVVGTLGYILLGGVGIIAYERTITKTTNGYIALRGGVGGWAFWGEGGRLTMLSGTYIHGTGPHYLELGASVFTNYNKQNYESAYYNDFSPDPKKMDFIHFLPGVHAGYRLQKPGKPFLLRAGVGFPESIFIGAGVAF